MFARTLVALLGLAELGAAPTAQLGPQERADSTPLDAPIDRVTVYSRRPRSCGSAVQNFRPVPMSFAFLVSLPTSYPTQCG